MKSFLVFLALVLINNLLFAKENSISEEKVALKFYSKSSYDSAAIYFKKAAEIHYKKKEMKQSIITYRYLALSLYENAYFDSAQHYTEKTLAMIIDYYQDKDSVLICEQLELMLIKANIYSEYSEFDSALSNYSRVLLLNERKNNGNISYYIRTQIKIGNLYKNNSDYSMASGILNMLRDTIFKINLQVDTLLSDVHYHLGMLYSLSKSPDEAINHFEKAILLQKKLYGEIHYITACSYRQTGLCYAIKGDYDQALELITKGLKLLNKTRRANHPDIAHCYNYIGTVYHVLEDYKLTHSYYSKSFEILKHYKRNSQWLATIYTNLGMSYNSLQDYYKAIDHHKKSMRYAIKVVGEKHIKVAICYANIAASYYRIGKYDLAIENNYKALSIIKEILGEDHMLVTYIYGQIGLSLSWKGDYIEALKYYQICLDRQTIVLPENHLELATTYFNIAIVYGHLNDFNKEILYLKKALSIRESVFKNGNTNLIDNYHAIGANYLETNRYDSAIFYYTKTIEYSPVANMMIYDSITENFFNTSNFHSTTIIKTLFDLSKCYYKKYQADKTITNLDLTVKFADYSFRLISYLLNYYSREEAKLFISRNSKKQLDFIFHAAIEKSKRDAGKNKYQTFRFIENSKAITLSSLLNESKVYQYSDMPKSVINKIQELQKERNYYQTHIENSKYNKSGYDTVKIQDFEDKYFYYSTQYDSIIDDVESRYPKYYHLKYNQKYADAMDIQSAMDKHTAMINYYTSDTALFVVVIKNSSISELVIPIDSTFILNAKEFNQDIRNIDINGFTEKSYALYKKLILPFERELAGCENLIIIPDDYLFYIPFEALVSNPVNTSERIDFTRLDYLIKKFSVVYHYSANLWLNSYNKSVENNILALENDDFNKNITKDFLGFAPVFGNQSDLGYIKESTIAEFDSTSLDLTVRSFSHNDEIVTLPNTENELNLVIKLYEKKNKIAKCYFHNEATEGNFVDNCHKYKHIHLATHGFANDEQPNLSGIVFASPSNGDQQINENSENSKNQFTYQDGILYTGEVYNLNLNAELVVLSACESGIGKLIKGEGMMSLTRGFLYSGASNVMFSLWKVNDKSTKELMIEFYKQYLDSDKCSRSLQNSKLEMIKNPYTAFPMHWAGFLVIGN